MKRLFFILCLCGTLWQMSAQTGEYKMAGPYEIVAREGQYSRTKNGSERDMKAALTFAREGKDEQALAIINAYANTLQRFDGHGAPLCGIQGYWLVRAMTLMKSHQTPEWAAMVRRAMLPVIDRFEAYSPYANGNWGAIVNRCRMACAIFLDDKALYNAAIDYHLHANDNGSLPKYISETGQCQETGRDQGHAQLGLGALCEICEMAWEQGDDLWGALDNRMLTGMEYTAKYNLGYDVPFETWTDCTGLYNDWTAPGEMGRGVIRDIYGLAYNHYVGRRGLKMPYTERILAIKAKAEKRGEIKKNIEADQFRVPGVKEGVKLHQVFTYPAPQGAPLKHDYDVYVQPRGKKEWTKIDTYMAKVNAPVRRGHRHRPSSDGDIVCLLRLHGRRVCARGLQEQEVQDGTHPPRLPWHHCQRTERQHRPVPAVPARERQRGVRRRHHRQPAGVHLESRRSQRTRRRKAGKKQKRSSCTMPQGLYTRTRR